MESLEVVELSEPELKKLGLARKWLSGRKIVWDVMGGVGVLKVGTTRYVACREDLSDVEFEDAFKAAFPDIALKMDEEAKTSG